MPEDRLIHRRLARSRKVSALDDLAFRVWIDTILFADDRGVLPRSSALLRGQVLALQHRSDDQIDAVLTCLVEVGLLVAFDHQGCSWLCHPQWREHQNFSYVRSTSYPSPPREIFPKLSRRTVEMFRKSFGKVLARPSPSPSPSPKPPLPPQGAVSGFERFWVAYPKKTGKGAARKAWAVKKPNADVVVHAVEQQRTSAQWAKDGGRFIPNPATWLNQERWLDEPSPNGGRPDDPYANFPRA